MPAGVPAWWRGRYGIDAPFVPVLLVVLGIGLLAAGAVTLAGGGRSPGAAVLWLVWDVLAGLVLVGSAAVYLHTTLRGKFTVWSEVIAGLGLRGDERVLDIGCGRGAVLVLLAQRLESGRAVGVDLWRGADQSGNTATAAQANAQAEGVAERVEVRTGDMIACRLGMPSSTWWCPAWPSTTSLVRRPGPPHSRRRCGCCAPAAGWRWSISVTRVTTRTCWPPAVSAGTTAAGVPMKGGVIRRVIVVVVILHGLLHLLGAAKGFGWAQVSQLSQPIGPALGAAWLAAGALVVLAAVLLGAGIRWWWAVGALAVVASQAVILTSWTDAKVGSVANVVLLAAIVYGYAAQGPASYRAEYRRRVHTALAVPRSGAVVTEADLSALPPSVATYVRRCGGVGQPRVVNFRARIHGRIRAGADTHG